MFTRAFNQLFRTSRVASSGLTSHRKWMDTIANNIANIHTVDTGKRDKKGNMIPYTRQVPVFSQILSEKFRENKVREEVVNGVKVKRIHSFDDRVLKVYDPTHPAARKPGSTDAGYVYYPDVDLAQEMTDIKVAQNGYEANLTVIEASSKMFYHALNLGKKS